MSTGPGHGDQDPIEMRQCNAASLLHVLQQSYGSYQARSNSYHAVTIVQDRYRKRRGDPEEL
jgi:hypothetical protein